MRRAFDWIKRRISLSRLGIFGVVVLSTLIWPILSMLPAMSLTSLDVTNRQPVRILLTLLFCFPQFVFPYFDLYTRDPVSHVLHRRFTAVGATSMSLLQWTLIGSAFVLICRPRKLTYFVLLAIAAIVVVALCVSFALSRIAIYELATP